MSDLRRSSRVKDNVGHVALLVLLLSAPRIPSDNPGHAGCLKTIGRAVALRADTAVGAADACAATRKNKQLTIFSELGLSAPLLKALQDEGYQEPTAIQVQGHPHRAGRPRPPRHRPDRHRQDRRVRAADHPPTGGRPSPGSAQGLPRACAQPDPRARDPDRRELPHLWPTSRPDRDGRVRRRRPSTADPGAGARRRRAGGHARAGSSTTSRSATSVWRTPRSSSSTRPTRCWIWASCRRSAGSSPSCPRSGRTCSSPRPCRPRSAGWPISCCAIRSRSQSPPRPRPWRASRSVCCTSKAPTSARCWSSCSRTSRCRVRWSSRAPSAAPTGSPDTSKLAGIRVAAIHGNKSQSQREQALAAFRASKIRALVATDIAARGIDVDQVTHVVNFELPDVPESYVHRIGRTARAGAQGIAISLCDADERDQLRDIERLIRQPIPAEDRRQHPARSSDHSKHRETKPKPRGAHPTKPPAAGGRFGSARQAADRAQRGFRGNGAGGRSSFATGAPGIRAGKA